MACGDPNDPRTTIGTLVGVVRDADTEAPIEGVHLVVGGIEGQSGSDGRFTIDSVPVGAQQVTATVAGYVGQAIEVEIRVGDTEEITLELVPETGPPGPSGVAATRRYRAIVGSSPTDISSALGRSIYIDGELHIMMGATLLRVD